MKHKWTMEKLQERLEHQRAETKRLREANRKLNNRLIKAELLIEKLSEQYEVSQEVETLRKLTGHISGLRSQSVDF